jgi:hypothetical protein
MHHKCREFSKQYLQCRMDRQLMAQEDLDKLGYGKDQEVIGAEEYDKSKERAGYIAGKHIAQSNSWWWKKSKKNWTVE